MNAYHQLSQTNYSVNVTCAGNQLTINLIPKTRRDFDKLKDYAGDQVESIKKVLNNVAYDIIRLGKTNVKPGQVQFLNDRLNDFEDSFSYSAFYNFD